MKLAKKVGLDDLLFHRVIGGFMIQGGDPNSKNAKPGVALGMGGPNYTVPAEFVDSLCTSKDPSQQPGQAALPIRKAVFKGRSFTGTGQGLYEPKNWMGWKRIKASATLLTSERYTTTLGGTPQLDREYTVFKPRDERRHKRSLMKPKWKRTARHLTTDVKMKVKVIK
ncbi:MAG: peptidylprolyl isomerase [Saprospiraceae bacterium]